MRPTLSGYWSRIKWINKNRWRKKMNNISITTPSTSPSPSSSPPSTMDENYEREIELSLSNEIHTHSAHSAAKHRVCRYVCEKNFWPRYLGRSSLVGCICTYIVHFDRPQCVTLRFYYIIRTACVFDALKKKRRKCRSSESSRKKSRV